MGTRKRKEHRTLAEYLHDIDEEIRLARLQAGYPLDEDISDGLDPDEEEVDDPPLESHLPRLW